MSTAHARINFRLSPKHKRLIEQAAIVRGQTMTDFIVSGLLELATAALDDAHVRRLTERDSETFLKMLANPPKPNAALKRAAERYKKHKRG